MTASRQLPLALPHRPALDRQEFLVAPCNQAAVAWIDGWPNWPGPCLVLAGPKGSGKTHLAAVWRARSGARVIGADGLDRPDLALGDAKSALLEDASAALPQEGLLHLFNLLKERGGHLLITAEEAPSRWGLTLKDLSSRLQGSALAVIGAPDDDLLSAVLLKQMADRQIMPSPEAVAYLTARMERSFAAVQAIAEALDRASLAQKRAVTLALARQVLDGMNAPRNV